MKIFRTVALTVLALIPYIHASTAKGSLPHPDTLAKLIAHIQTRDQGPFKGIYWYCTDGRVLHAKDTVKCNEEAAIQHGALRDDLAALSRKGLWLGQLLAGQKLDALLDKDGGHQRILQYLVEQWLVQSQDGWIFRRARTYRGAIQPEDEQHWADSLRKHMLTSNLASEKYFLVRTLVDRLPEAVPSKGLRERIRWTSRAISDSVPRFLPLRAKIHGVPGPEDLDSVVAWRSRAGKQKSVIDTLFNILERDLRKEYKEIPVQRRANLRKDKMLNGFPASKIALDSQQTPDARIQALANLLVELRNKATQPKTILAQRVQAVQRSLLLEQVLLELATENRPTTVGAALSRGRLLAHAMVGTGMLEPWEEIQLFPPTAPSKDAIPLDTLKSRAATLRAATEWGLGTLRGTMGPAVDLFSSFEPDAAGFLDDMARQSLLLELGSIVDRLQGHVSKRNTPANAAKGILIGARGLQAGVAMGRLQIVESPSQPLPSKEDIAVLATPPASLKPVAGILSLSEGNPVSHVQLLARNLGIASAVISPSLLDTLRRFAGKMVFLAVSPDGLVFLKDSSAMDSTELALVRKQAYQAPRQKLAVDTRKLLLDRLDMPDLDSLRSSHSGVLCGPKAANLGQLASQFPGRVPKGFVLPFGIFKAHMDQKSPNGMTYWQSLAAIYAEENESRKAGVDAAKVEATTLASLAKFRETLLKMPLRPGFADSLRTRYKQVFARDASKVGVFVRSDTNMEDLKDFTGAGLNKTIPNVVGEKAVHDAIREVWASAFSERSYLWRQRFLQNPLDIYPSVLLLESVNADASGVVLTSTLGEGSSDEFLISVNRGIGGAVDGQASESWFLGSGGKARLRMPAREPSADILPSTGGIRNRPIAWNQSILDSAALVAFRSMGEQVRTVMGTAGMPSPYDSEMAWKDGRVVLLQVRPLKSSKGGPARDWLAKLDAKPATTISCLLAETLQP